MILANNPIVYLTRMAWRHTPRKSVVVLYVSLTVVANSLSLLEPLVMAQAYNIIQQEGVAQWSSLKSICFWLLVRLALCPLFWIFHGVSRVIERKNAFMVKANYRNYLTEGVLSLSSDWHSSHHSGDIIDKVNKGTSAIYRFAADSFELVQMAARLIGACVMLFYFETIGGAISVITIVLVAVLIVSFDKVLIKQYKKLNLMENKITEKIFDVISNINTVIILRVEHLAQRSIKKSVMEPYQLQTKNNKINEVKWFLVSLGSTVMLVLVFSSYLLKYHWLGLPIMLGSVMAVVDYAGRITDSFFNFAGIYSDKVVQKASVMNSEILAVDFPPIGKNSGSKILHQWEALRINSLNFSYHSNDEDLHLDDVSLTIKRGSKIAFIGKSGSGKTTMLKVMRELFPPSNVEVYLDDKLLQNGFNDISGSIALIPQDPDIFAASIGENITMGLDVEESKLKRFTDLACFSGVLAKLPRGLNSFIFERGVNLSGGEKQRLALARGLMVCEDKDILLLDEPTSSVDSDNERTIYDNIFQTFPEKTIISSIHSLHLLPQFDQICLFEDGKIVASGTFQDLLDNSEYFQDLWSKYQDSSD